MSSNLPISGSGSPNPIERAAANDKSEVYSIEASSVANIQTSKELRAAELSGEHVTLSDIQVIKAIERANKALQGMNTSVQFSIHDKTKQIMVKVLDSETGQVIREVPPEKILDLVSKFCEMSGLLVDERR